VEAPIPAPNVIVNPVSGQTVTFLAQTPDALRTHFAFQAGGERDPRHVHPQQVEAISVVKGRIRRSLPDASEDVLGPGQGWEIPAGTPHTWAAIDPHVELQIDFRPALRTRDLMTRLFGLVEAGRTNSKGVPKPLQTSVIAIEYESEFRLASPPWGLQKILMAAAAPLARMLGYRP
jgi:quercetin dioxygenase-like cupin family protein